MTPNITRRLTRKQFVCVGLALLCPALLAGCGGGGHDGGTDATVAESGTVRHESFEGGFYAIVGDSQQSYDPANLAADFQQDGLRVKFQAKVLVDQNSPHLFGKPVQITRIEKL